MALRWSVGQLHAAHTCPDCGVWQEWKFGWQGSDDIPPDLGGLIPENIRVPSGGCARPGSLVEGLRGPKTRPNVGARVPMLDQRIYFPIPKGTKKHRSHALNVGKERGSPKDVR